MIRHPARYACLLLLLGLAGPAEALIQRLYSLEEVLKECTDVVVGRLEKVDTSAQAVVMRVDRALKGKVEYGQVNMNIGLGPAHHAKCLMRSLKRGEPAILYYQRKDRSIACLVHAGDVWFQLFATDEPKKRDKVWWRFTHIELHMNRTFNGPTGELIKLTDGVLAGRVRSPKPDPKVPQFDPRRAVTAAAPHARSSSPNGKAVGFGRQVRFRHDGGGEIRGVSFVDVNGDGLLDAYLCRQAGNVLLVNQGETFKDASREMGLAHGSRCASWADYNGDDHPDLVTNDFRLFTNIGGRFRDDSKLLPAAGGRNPEGAGWIDYNGDGRPDVLITNGEHGIRLYENTGVGPRWFRDVSDEVGLGGKGLGVGNGDFAAFFDYDGDGYADFFYNVSAGVLAHNGGNGRFAPAGRSGLELPGGSGYKRGLAVADYDNDGDLDVFVPAEGRPRLYRNNNDGTFTDVLDDAGDLARADQPSFAAAWGDVNGDGRLDLFVCHTRGGGRLYLGGEGGRFSDVSAEAGADALAFAWAAAFADVDDDGDLDLVVNLRDEVVIALNDVPQSDRHRPVSVHVHARKGAIGAVVRVLDERGRLLGLRELNGAEGCGGQACPIAHFGLPVGRCRLSVALSDGRVATKSVTVAPGGGRQSITLGDDEFR